jgi:hypothetical protein
MFAGFATAMPVFVSRWRHARRDNLAKTLEYLKNPVRQKPTQMGVSPVELEGALVARGAVFRKWSVFDLFYRSAVFPQG